MPPPLPLQPVSLLELEMQAEVDKYASALRLMLACLVFVPMKIGLGGPPAPEGKAH